MVGIPPPPPTITIEPNSTFFLIDSIPRKSIGLGEGTTLRYPLPASSIIVESGLFFFASSKVL